MTKRTTPLLLAAFLVAACGSSTEPSIDMDGKAEVAKGDAKDAKGEVCTPDCAGKECGSDGCSGSCGDCHMLLEECNAEGQCVAFACESSKDCPGSLVCAKEIGDCVACVVDADCGEGEVCGTDFECHEQIACESDKECKDDGMVCDMEAGQCVECLETTDCADEEYCKEQFCVADECVAGETYCDANSVTACLEDGSGRSTAETCGEGQYCEEAACHDYACTPGAVWCEGDVLSTCSEDGKSVTGEEDCGAEGKHCFDDECIDTVCVPMEKFCVDDFSYGLCAADGMEFTTYDCPAEQYCEGGDCFAQVCPPGSVYCQGDALMTCDPKGSAVLNQEDCAASGKYCANGQCIDCQPLCEGKACGDDGCGGNCGACPANVLCQNGQCSGCDDGNDIDWDGCTDGEVTEYRVNKNSLQDQKGPSVAVTDDGGFIITWRGHKGQGTVLGIHARLFDASGAPLGADVEIASQEDINYGGPRAAALPDGKYVIIWQESPSQGGCCEAVAGQLVGADGSLLGPPLQANTTAESGLFGVDIGGSLSAGFVAAWAGKNGADYWLRYQRFTSTGVKEGSEVTLSKGKRPFVAGFGDGSLVIAYNHNSSSGAYVSVVSANDELLLDALAVDSQGSLHAVSGYPDSRYAVAWSKPLAADDPSTIRSAVYSKASDNPESELAVFSGFPASSHLSVTAALDGALVITWSGIGDNTDSLDVFLQRFDVDGEKLGTEQLVHAYTSGWQTHQHSAVFSDSSFIIVWDSDDQDGSGKGIFAQRFDAEGNKLYH